MVRVLGIGDGYAGGRQMRSVEDGQDEGGVGTEDSHNMRVGYL